MADEVSADPDPREMDMLLSTGERISCALCAMAINDLGHERSRSPARRPGSSPTPRTPRRASSTCAPTASATRSTRTRSCSSPASRASRPPRDVTTLGRGGSDTTAVALAAAIGAEVCEIYTDVDGVFTADPRIVPDARKLPVVSFEEMLEMAGVRRRRAAAALGRVRAQPRRAHPLPLELQRRARYRCRRRGGDHGTPAHHRRHPLDRRGARHAAGVPDTPGVAGRIFTALADANVNVDMIIQNEPRLRGRAGRHVVHRPARRPAPRRATRSTPIVGELGIARSRTTRRWARSRSSAPA